MIKVQTSFDSITITIPVETAKIQNADILAKTFDAVLGLIDEGYIDVDEIEELFQDAVSRVEGLTTKERIEQ